jgi:2-(1,2-epoxy-1,2-dihydrophenyl)acetyl-CoA isomerase
MLIQVDRPAVGVVRLLINRPDKRNAIDYDVRAAILEAFTDALSDDSCRAIVFGGVEGVFSAGGDLPSMVGLSEEQARERLRHIATICQLVVNSPKPVVSAVEGFGAGAAVGLALAGDYIVVGEGTKIMFPFLNLGLVPDWGMLRTLPARVGTAKARNLLTNTKPLSGQRAYDLGVADEFAEDIMAAAVKHAERMAAFPQGAFARLKQRLITPSKNWDEELQREEDDQQFLLRANDFKEGFDAFAEKRRPKFTDLA